MKSSPLSELPAEHRTVKMHGFEAKVYENWSPPHLAKDKLPPSPAGVVRRESYRCPHLGAKLPDDLLVMRALCGCRNNMTWKEVELDVHECAEHGRCVPHYRCAKTAVAEEVVSGELAQACLICGLNPVNLKKGE